MTQRPSGRARRQLHGLLRRSVERDPARFAWISDNRIVRYDELEDEAARFAATLRRLGVRRGDRVALVFDGSSEYLVAYYGILKAGGVVVPGCPDVRAGGLARMLEHSGACALVIQGRQVPLLAEACPDGLRSVIAIGPAPAEPPRPGLTVVSWLEAVAGPETLEDEGAAEEDLAALQYTSGTTGAPKGVMLSHRNLVSNVGSIVQYLGLGPRDTVGMVLPYFYVYGNSVLHTHLAVGGTIAQLGSMAFVAKVVEGLERHRCTGFSGVPSTYTRLLSYEGLGGHDLSSLRYVTQAGAAMSPATVARVRSALPGARVFVMYGQTEASARLAYVPPQDLDRKTGSAGRAIPGMELAIVDADGVELPPGALGEVVARGESITRGYWRDPEATAEAIRPEGLRTGDLGHMDEEGFLYLVGRDREMIKSGAHRIAPREIEEVIEEIGGVSECGVVGMPDALLGEAIVAVVVRERGATVTEKDVQRACHRALPRFKVPARVTFHSDLPRTPTGKLKRRELRDILGSDPAMPAAEKEPG